MAKQKKRFVLLRGMVVEQEKKDLSMLRVGRWNKVTDGLPTQEGWYDVRINNKRKVFEVRMLCVKVPRRGMRWRPPESHPNALDGVKVTHWRGLTVCKRRV